MKSQRSLMQPFLSNESHVFDTYEKFGLNRYNAVYDRSGNVPHYLNMDPAAHPFPDNLSGFNKSFYQVSEERCKQLLSFNKPINVMWSGGLDSTYALFLLHHLANDKDQVRVYGTYNSIIESGDLFDRRIKDKIKYDISIAKNNNNKYNDDAIYVSGMCGNQLFGPTDNMFANGGKAMFHHTLGTPTTIYESYKDNVNPEFIEFLKPAIDASPRKIETVADLRWYCIFNLDWYTAIYEHKILLEEERSNRIHGFFNSDDFQRWAITTKEPFTKVKGNPNTHRWQMRQILDEVFGESHYAKNITKKISNFGITDSDWILLLNRNHTVMMG
jgi:hypothetical protein